MTAPAAAPACARSHRMREHGPLVHRIARRLRARLPAGADLDELLQAGMLGLDEALTRFEDGQGASFDTYASRRIQGAMLDLLRRHDPLPREARLRQRQLRQAVQRLEHRLLRAPRAQEVANELGWALDAVHRCLAEAGAGTLRAGEALSDEPPAEVAPEPAAGNGTPDTHGCPLTLLQRRQRHAALNLAFDALEQRERQLMTLIYEHGLDHRDTAATLGVTPSRVSQLHSAIVAKLQRRLRDW